MPYSKYPRCTDFYETLHACPPIMPAACTGKWQTKLRLSKVSIQWQNSVVNRGPANSVVNRGPANSVVHRGLGGIHSTFSKASAQANGKHSQKSAYSGGE